MLKIFYFHSDILTDFHIENYYGIIPDFMILEIAKYSQEKDRINRLISRLMLIHALNETGCGDFISQWKINSYGKPFISKWFHFNISHCDGSIVFAYSDKLVGIDVENVNELVLMPYLNFMCEDERAKILNSQNSLLEFYNIWVKKEALFKAEGSGLSDDINLVSCISDSAFYKNKAWYLNKIQIQSNTICYVCTPQSYIDIVIERFMLPVKCFPAQ